MNEIKALALAGPALLVLTATVTAQEHQDINDANNPLTPKITLNLQDYYIPNFQR